MKNSIRNIVLTASLVCLCLSSCNHRGGQHGGSDIDSLNQRAYNFRYSNVDSLVNISEKVCQMSGGFNGYALINLSYAAYQQMDYKRVDSLLNVVYASTNNQIYLLCADVMAMKMAQRVNAGVAFFQAKRSAEKRMARIEEERDELSEEGERLLTYASSEYQIILSTYYYYQKKDSLAAEAIDKLAAMNLARTDAAQWIYYNYMLGSGGLIRGNDPKRVALAEFDHLMLTYSFARRLGYIYFEANALQALSSMYEREAELLELYRYDECKMLEAQNMSWADDDLALAMSNHAIYLFKTYNDLFQTACAYRSRGELCFDRGEYEESIDYYSKALQCVNQHHITYYETNDTLCLYDPSCPESSVEVNWLRNPDILTVPEWIAGIRQQLSMAFSAVGDKSASDYNRNAYLDILFNTNQNDELEDRNNELTSQARATVRRLIIALLTLAVMIVLAFVCRKRLRRRKAALTERFERLRNGEDVPQSIASLDEESNDLAEKLQVSRHNMAVNKASNVEDRAKVSLVYAIVPYLDRIGAEVMKMKRSGKIEDFSRKYITELAEEIEKCNTALTEWIKITQGDLSLHITTVSLQKLFSIVAEGHYPFDQKGVTLRVGHTQANVKADEALTLFMLNTLADNARKFTPEGGLVTLQTKENEEYVEVQVSDTGCGLTQEELDAVNTGRMPATFDADSPAQGQKGFGFGLMNCHSIIEKYKKHSSIFNCCTFGAKSEKGKGSVFFFRLPRALLCLMFLLLSPFCLGNTPEELYDSVYQCNIEGRYDDALMFGEEALRKIDERMLLCDPQNDDVPQEILCYHNGDDMDYQLIMGLRNELALTALAVNDWALYEYNNAIYTQIQKLVNQDETLPEYCERLERFHHSGHLLLAFIIVFACVAFILLYRSFISSERAGEVDLGKRIDEFVRGEREVRERTIASQRDALAKCQFEENRLHVQNQILDNCLSAIKHESMYYPSRIRLLTEKMGDDDIGKLDELVSYYRHIYTILSSQANAQIEKPSFKRQTHSVDTVMSIFETAHQRLVKKGVTDAALEVERTDASVLCDAVMIAHLSDNLLKWATMGAKRICVSATEVGKFVDISVHIPDAAKTEEELHNIFEPASGHTTLLIAKQIIREHDMYSGTPGLRLFAKPENDGYAIHFTLLKK